MKIINSVRVKHFSILLFALSMLGYADESEAPSMAFFEFLAEFNDVEDDEFDVLVFHALEDSEQTLAIPVVEKTTEPVVEQRVGEFVEEQNDEKD